MSNKIDTGVCTVCSQRVRVEQANFNTLLHLIVAVITCGLWIPIWLIASFSPRPWKCGQCGSKVTIVGPTAVARFDAWYKQQQHGDPRYS